MDVGTLIVGAGPYAVTLACELHRRGRPFAVVGEPFELWRRHTLDAMVLRSGWLESQLWTADGRLDMARFLAEVRPGGVTSIRQARRRPLALDTFRTYLDWCAARLPYPIRDDRITELDRRDGVFLAATRGGETLRAQAAVLATGFGVLPVAPEELAGLPASTVIHAWDIEHYRDVRDARVLVVGAGQSAAEACRWLAPHNEVLWSSRRPPRFMNVPANLPRLLFEAASRTVGLTEVLPAMLRTLLDDTFNAVSIAPRLRPTMAGIRRVPWPPAVREGCVEVEGRPVDLVVCGTGYLADASALPFLSPALRAELRAANGHGGYATAVPGLFVTGSLAEPRVGPALRFLLGCRHATLRVAAQLTPR